MCSTYNISAANFDTYSFLTDRSKSNLNLVTLHDGSSLKCHQINKWASVKRERDDSAISRSWHRTQEAIQFGNFFLGRDLNLQPPNCEPTKLAIRSQQTEPSSHVALFNKEDVNETNQTVRVCVSTPRQASRITTALSTAARLRSTSKVKSTCPGVSIRLRSWFFHRR